MLFSTLSRLGASAALVAVAALPAYGQSSGLPEIKVDLNQAGRQEAEVNEPGYLPWAVSGGTSASETFEGVTVTLSQQGSGSGLRTDWYKAGIDSHVRLASDGVTVNNGENGGAIEMTLSGLPAGEHSLQLYISTVANPANNTFSPVHISVNGERVVNGLVPSNRVYDNADATSAFLAFTVSSEDVVVLVEPDMDSDASQKNVIINGFEINTPDVARQARTPVPADRDYHVTTDEGELVISWTPADGAVAHELYFGTDEAAVRAGDAQVFQGRQASIGYRLENTYSRDRYYWRVDQVDADGLVTRGEVWSFQPRQLAFPGAEGYGRFAIGGRGGQVVKVTSLANSGPGTLREAVEQTTGPRTVIFDVGGTISLESRLVIGDGFVTVAGQTAPGKGILIRGAPFGLSGAEDVVLQHVRVRLGAGDTADGIGMAGSNHSIVDRSSISWTLDEAFSSRNARNISLQRTLISEALNAAGHSNYPAGTMHGFAASISGDVGSFHHNLLAHNDGRNWSLAGGLDANGFYAGRLDIFNNVVYNWRNRTTDGGAHEVNFVNNYYKPGPATQQYFALNAQYDQFPGTQRYYCSGNFIPGRVEGEDQRQACRVSAGRPNGYEAFVSEPFFPSHATIHTATHAYKNVLSDVGASQPVRDDHDARMIRETQEGNFNYRGSVTNLPGLPDHEDDVGGYEDFPITYRPDDWDTDNDGLPDWWERLHGLNTNSAMGDLSDAHADFYADGYSQLDHYLQWMAEPHAFINEEETLAIDVAGMFRGYTEAPEYSVVEVSGGTTEWDGTTLVFTPDSCGLAALTLRVEDAEGDSMTQRKGVFVDTVPEGACVGSVETVRRPEVSGEPVAGDAEPEQPVQPESRSSGAWSFLGLLLLVGLFVRRQGSLKRWYQRPDSNRHTLAGGGF